MCNSIKLQRQLKKEQSLTNKDLGDFCSQYDPSYIEPSKSKCKGKCPPQTQKRKFNKYRKTKAQSERLTKLKGKLIKILNIIRVEKDVTFLNIVV